MRSQVSLLIAGLVGAASAATKSLDLRLMTYNIRMAATVPGTGEEFWSVRQPKMSAQLNYETAGRPETLLCMQEVLFNQLTDLDDAFGEEWTYVGVGRDDGAQGGEFSPIFYRPSTWHLVDNTTYWLSETPEEVGSVGWDAALPRIVTVAKFKHIDTGAGFVYMCTHFDHVGQTAREKSAELLVKIAAEVSPNNSSGPVFLGGDLNVTPDNAAYVTLASEMTNVADVVPQAHHFGNVNTFTGFTTDTADDTELDHIFVANPSGMEWKSHAVLNSRYDDGIFISDHRPVVVDFKMPVKHEESRLRRSRARGQRS